MEAMVMKKIGEILIRKSAIMDLLRYIDERARGGDIKEIRDFNPEVSLSELVISEREEE